EPRQPGLGEAPYLHQNRPGYVAAHVWLVGRCQAPELPWRPLHGSGLVPPDLIWPSVDIFLFRLHGHPAGASRTARSHNVPNEVPPGLGGILPEGAVAHPARDLLRVGWRPGKRRLGHDYGSLTQ